MEIQFQELLDRALLTLTGGGANSGIDIQGGDTRISIDANGGIRLGIGASDKITIKADGSVVLNIPSSPSGLGTGALYKTPSGEVKIVV